MTRINSSGSPKATDTSVGEQRTKWAQLHAGSATLRSLKIGVEGFTPNAFGWGYLHLSNGHILRVHSVDTQVASRFECFSLKMEPEDVVIDASMKFAPLVDPAVSVLIREEYVEPYDGDATGLVGGPPRTIQQATVPGRVPAHALMSCRVAFGVLWEGVGARLVAVADWAPFNVRVTADEEAISAFLGQSEIVPVETYIQEYGVLP